jgi:hypothetical protein
MDLDVAAFFSEYARRYMEGDAAAVAEDQYAAPFLAVRDGSAILLPDRAAVVDHLTGLMAAYRRAGASAAEIAELVVSPQGDAATLVTIRWNVRRADGSVVRDFSTTYQLVARPAPRVVSYVNHDVVGSA